LFRFDEVEISSENSITWSWIHNYYIARKFQPNPEIILFCGDKNLQIYQKIF